MQVDSIDEGVKASQMSPVLESGGSVEVGRLLEIMQSPIGQIPERVGSPAARSATL